MSRLFITNSNILYIKLVTIAFKYIYHSAGILSYFESSTFLTSSSDVTNEGAEQKNESTEYVNKRGYSTQADVTALLFNIFAINGHYPDKIQSPLNFFTQKQSPIDLSEYNLVVLWHSIDMIQINAFVRNNFKVQAVQNAFTIIYNYNLKYFWNSTHCNILSVYGNVTWID